MRMGGKEAGLHLGVPILDRAAERETVIGIERCTRALRSLAAAGHDIRIGSGAPGIGLAPGAALREEAEMFENARARATGAMA